ncbi:hypothetical protein [Bathymodiolus heckerae thiotrophic gill symbiont]|uniref:hypothetical protein n=1 Tax=Bathymodiolus heckerae thiotrophic gill symbiont TaxID=1052212 RepID=UPI0010FD86A2|nr:hypothetical protein [Bathymodiolus heckerae thiotrophic gill symbiont]
MKKMVSVSLMIVALNASANFGSGPWSNNGWNNGGNSNNGFIAHNPHSMFTPDWFSEEMDDMMDEFDSNNTPWSNNNNFNNQRPWSNNYSPTQNRNWNQGPWGNSQPFNFRNNSFGPMNNGPWNNTNRSVQPTTK